MSYQRLATVTIAMLVGLGVVAGARAGAAPPRPGKTPKACSLLTTREVSKVLGMSMQPGKPRSIRGPKGLTTGRCDWESSKKGAGGISGKSLQFNVATFTGEDAPKALQGLLVQDLGRGIEYHPVPALGDDAVYEVPTHSLATLSSDNRMLLIVRINPESLDTSKVDLEAEDATVAAATLAVPRLAKG